MRLGDLLVEAKLTESNFQAKDVSVVRGYRDFQKIFAARLLEKAGSKFLSYQLIRNVLAAFANSCAFCVLLDARRPDLLESWHDVMRAVRPLDMRLRCKVLTWQELSEVLPTALAAIPRYQVRHRARWPCSIALTRRRPICLTKTGQNVYISVTTA